MEFSHRQTIALTSTNVVSVLISAQFLGMCKLERISLDYLHANYVAIVQVPIDFTCLNADLLTRLSRRFKPIELVSTIDVKDRLKSKMYIEKVDELVETLQNDLRRCGECGCVYKNGDFECQMQTPKIDWMGRQVRYHTMYQIINIAIKSLT